MRTYTYINHIGIKKQLNVGDKTKDGKYPTSIYAIRGGIPCECCGTNIMSEEELEEYIKHYKASPTGEDSTCDACETPCVMYEKGMRGCNPTVAERSDKE